MSQTDRFSFSQLALYAACPEAYRRKYVEGEPDTSESLPTAVGTALHTAIETWEGGKGDFTQDDLVTLAVRELQDHPNVHDLKVFGRQDYQWWVKTGIPAKVEGYLKFRRTEYASNIDVIESELEVFPEIAGVPFLGYIDQVAQGRHDRIVRDIKSGKPKKHHAMQLQFYMLAYAKLTGYEGRLFGQLLYLAEDPQVDVVPLTLTWQQAEQMVEALKRARQHEAFMPAGPFNDYCGWCAYKSSCPWGQVGESNVLRGGKK